MQPLTLAQANQMITQALARAQQAGYRAMGIVVLDDAGHMKAAQRQDGASMFRLDIARGKAWAAVGMGANSRELTQRAKDLPHFFNALATAGQGKFIAQTGAVLFKDAEGHVLGAIGASGGTGDEDEAICIHGVQAAGLVVG